MTQTQGTNQREQIFVRGTCSKCSEVDVLLYAFDDSDSDLLCAEDYRKLARQIRWTQSCDKCGAPKAIRDPSHRRNEYLCGSCHEKDNGFLHAGTTVFKRALVALTNSARTINKKEECYLKGYGSPCDDNVKPRGAWGGKTLCNLHGKKPPKT